MASDPARPGGFQQEALGQPACGAVELYSGRLLARIPVGANPHGLAFFPQPGRYSLGHTGNFR